MFGTLRAIALLSFSTLLLSANANAAGWTEVVRSGNLTEVATSTTWDHRCRPMSAEIELVKRPQHGSLLPRIESRKIPGIREGTARHCVGKTVKTTVLYYRSKKNFKGRDFFSYRTKGYRTINRVTVVVK